MSVYTFFWILATNFGGITGSLLHTLRDGRGGTFSRTGLTVCVAWLLAAAIGWRSSSCLLLCLLLSNHYSATKCDCWHCTKSTCTLEVPTNTPGISCVNDIHSHTGAFNFLQRHCFICLFIISHREYAVWMISGLTLSSEQGCWYTLSKLRVVLTNKSRQP